MEILHSIKNQDTKNQEEPIKCIEISNDQFTKIGRIRLLSPILFKYKNNNEVFYKFYFFSDRKVESIKWDEFITYLFRKDHKIIINIKINDDNDNDKIFLNTFNITTSTFSGESSAAREFDTFLKKRKGKKRLVIEFNKQIIKEGILFETGRTGSATTTNEEPDEGPEKAIFTS